MGRTTTPHSARRPSLLLWTVAFCVWVLFIWGHSLVPGPQSTLESDAAVSYLDTLFVALGITDTRLMTLVVRKGAHVLEYAVLGFLTRGTLVARREERGRAVMPVGILAALVPVVDECIQLVVPGRSGMVQDVLIDLAGMCLGALVGLGISRLRRR